MWCISTSANRNIIAAKVRTRTLGRIIGSTYTIKRNPQLPNIELKLLQFHLVESISLLPRSTFTPIHGKPLGQPNSSKKCRKSMLLAASSSWVTSFIGTRMAMRAVAPARYTEIQCQLLTICFIFVVDFEMILQSYIIFSLVV